MSDTPRTDILAQEWEALIEGGHYADDVKMDAYWEMRSHAEELERENAALKAKLPPPLPPLELPLSWEYNETGGYDCMYSGYDVKDAVGDYLFTLDGRHFGQETCEYGQLPRAEELVRWICDTVNRMQEGRE